MKRLGLTLGILAVFSAGFFLAGCDEQGSTQKTPEKSPDAKKLSANLNIPDEGKTTETTVEKPAQSGSEKTGPVIKFESTTHDFEQVSPKSTSKCEFKFTNAGSSVLEIKNVRTTCGCTVAKLSKKKYAPGESGEIQISFKAGVGTVPTQKHIYVLSNDGRHPSVTLTIKATVAKVIDHKPETINLSLKQKNAGCPEITIQSLDGKQFSITQFKSAPDCIIADFDPNRKATKVVLKPQVDLQKLKQHLSGTVRIYLDHPSCSLITIRYSAPAEFSTRPPTIFVFKAEPEKPVIRDDIWLMNNYGEDFDIESTSSQKGFVKVLSSQKVDKGRYKLKLQITPPEIRGNSRSFQDNFIIKIKGGQQVKVSCRGFYAGR